MSAVKTHSISEDDYFSLYQAKHLTWLLVSLTDRPCNEYAEISLNTESLSVVMGLLHEKLEAVIK